MADDPMADVPEPQSRYRYQVPWGIVLLLALVPLAALIALAVLG